MHERLRSGPRIAPGGRTTLNYTIAVDNRRLPRAEGIMVGYDTGEGTTPRELIMRVAFSPRGRFNVEPMSILLTKDAPKATLTVSIGPGDGPGQVLDVTSGHRCVRVDKSKLPTITLDLLGGFGRRPHGSGGECLADGRGVGDEVANRTPDAPPPQPVQSAGAEGRDVPLDGRAAPAGDFGGFRPRQATMH